MDDIAKLFDLALRHHRAGNPKKAEVFYRQFIAADPSSAAAYSNLGLVLNEQGETAQAIECFRQASLLDPNHLNAHLNLGNALKDHGQPARAEECYRQVLRLNPSHTDAYNNLGIALIEQGKMEEAIQCYRQAIRIDPNNARAYYNLGNVLKDQSQPALAEVCYRQALRINSNLAEANINLGNIFKDQGCIEEAISCFGKALANNPDNVAAHGNLILTLHFRPGQDAGAILEECRRWNQRHAQFLTNHTHSNDKSPGRQLRVGYFSPDFSLHPVGRFLLPLLASHDHSQFEIYCYSSGKNPDVLTERCRRHADVWQPVHAATDGQIAQQIHQDRIDILVDLAMHTADNRLLVFARKPAPVQVAYLAYCGTTGLDTMDYRLTDPFLDPPGQNDHCYSEASIRLPDTYWCYQPITDTPASTALPALTVGSITFGCLNNFCKVTIRTLETWRLILQALPEARLFLHSRPGGHRDRVRAFFAQGGIAPERLHWIEWMSLAELFRTYEHIDIALDPFPFGGATTTCDALWMRVPVVSLAGINAVGRAGVSILSNVGLTSLVAQDAEEYVRIAVQLARDLSRLTELRTSLRERMLKSPLMDAPRFARNVEAAYRGMWRQWCARQNV